MTRRVRVPAAASRWARRHPLLAAVTVLVLLVLAVRFAEPADPDDGPGLPSAGESQGEVDRVIDGDTLELTDGATVRLVGIDTPERGECGYEEARQALRELVEGRQVRVADSGQGSDRYDRVLRYIDVARADQDLDAGLRLIEQGLARARYDSRTGYPRHPREDAYVAADADSRPSPRC